MFAFGSILSILVAMILFCAGCGSDNINISRWDDKGRALFECASCEHARWVEGFTLSRLDLTAHLFGALIDQARKHRQRDPEDIKKLKANYREKKRLAERR